METDTPWERESRRRQELKAALETDIVLRYLSKYARARLLQFMLDTAAPLSAVSSLVLGLGETAVTDMPGEQKYSLSLIFGGQLTEVRDDDLPF